MRATPGLKVVLVVVAAGAGLVVWNAWRQADADSLEVMRPPATEVVPLFRSGPEATQEEQAPPNRDITPLRPNQACINGYRFETEGNTWSQIGTCAKKDEGTMVRRKRGA